LYDRALESLRDSRLPAIVELLPELAKIRDQEKEHDEFLEGVIRSCGREPSGNTPLAKLAKIESEGLERALARTDDAGQLLHSLLAAELVDEAGWDILVKLARETGDEKLARELDRRRLEEERHVALLRDEVENFLRQRLRSAA
jgi:hypothetical protein